MFRTNIFLFLVGSSLVLLITGGYIIEDYPIDWETVPNYTPEQRNLDSPYLGKCVCDQTRGFCDPNCCCDPDCSADIIEQFQHCLPEQYGYPEMEYCYAENKGTQIKKINTYIEKKVQAYDAICIVRANHPNELYKYFKVPRDVKKPSTTKIDSFSEETASYDIGGPLVLLKYGTSEDTTPMYTMIGNFQFPTQNSQGTCSKAWGRNIEFLTPNMGVSCSLNGNDMCTNFPVSQFTNLFVAPPGNSSQWTSSATPLNVVVYDASRTEIGDVDPTDLEWDRKFDSRIENGVCINAVIGVEFLFTYNTSTSSLLTLTSATAKLTVAPVTSALFSAVTFRSNFVAEGNPIPEKIISATVGYPTGGVLRAGTMVTQEDKKAVLERKYGFSMPSGGADCSTKIFRKVGFMHSVVSSGCSVQFNDEKLKDICGSGSRELIMDTITDTINGESRLIDYVAMTNDALVNDTRSWLQITGLDNLDFSPGSYDSLTRQCSDITVGIRYQFVVARAGAEYNPQDIIVGAFAEPIVGSWRIRGNDIFSNTATGSQYVRFEVQFSRYNPDSQETIMRKVKAPPILPRVDETIFYPFK